jgi:hypothetical protein
MGGGESKGVVDPSLYEFYAYRVVYVFKGSPAD